MATETHKLTISTGIGDDKKVNSTITHVNSAASDANLLAFAQQFNSLQDGTLDTVKVTTTRIVE